MRARNIRLATLLVLLTLAMMLGIPSAYAANITVINLTAPGETIGVEQRKAVFGINMTGSGTFQGLQVEIADAGGGEFDVAALSDLAASPLGVAVYRDTGTTDDVLEDGDTRVSTSFSNSSGSVTITVSSGIPAAAEGSYTYFLAVQTSGTIGDGDDFTVTIPNVTLGCAFQTAPATSFLNCSSGTSEVITANIAPTAELLSTPASPDGTVVWKFSESVTGVTNQNVVVREGLVGSTNLPATVQYDSGAKTATITPEQPLAAGQTYRTIVNPGNAPTPVEDADGNPVEFNQQEFALPQFGFTPGIVRGNVWYLNNDFDNDHDQAPFAFGRSTDVPVAGDWDGTDGMSPGLVRGNLWFLSDAFDGGQDHPTFAFGRPTDIPVVGDWNGDGTWTPGVVRGNVWYLSDNLNGVQSYPAFAFGRPTDVPVVGDWDGQDGKMSPGVVRGNTWFLSDNLTGTQTVPTFAFGRSTDLPLTGDWDGDQKTTPGLVRGNVWYLNNNFDASHDIPPLGFGRSTDVHLAGDWDGSIQP